MTHYIGASPIQYEQNRCKVTTTESERERERKQRSNKSARGSSTCNCTRSVPQKTYSVCKHWATHNKRRKQNKKRPRGLGRILCCCDLAFVSAFFFDSFHWVSLSEWWVLFVSPLFFFCLSFYLVCKPWILRLFSLSQETSVFNKNRFILIFHCWWCRFYWTANATVVVAAIPIVRALFRLLSNIYFSFHFILILLIGCLLCIARGLDLLKCIHSTHTYIFEVDSIVHRRRQRKNFHLPMHRNKMCLQCTEKSAHTDTQQTTSTWTANKMKNKTAKNNCEENEKQRKQHWKTVCEALNIREKSSNEVGLVHAGCCLVIFLMLTCAFKMLFTSLHLR